MPIRYCPYCQKETETLAPYYKCPSCEASLYGEPVVVGEVIKPNQIVVPSLNNSTQRPSIKHKINLKKAPLPWEQVVEQPAVISTEITETSVEPVQEPEIQLIQEEISQPAEVDIASEEKSAEEVVSPHIEVEETEKTLPKPLPQVESTPIVNPSINKPQIADPIMRQIMEEMEQRDRELQKLLQQQEEDAPVSRYIYTSKPHIPKVENTLADKQNKEIAGWLIRHTQGKEALFYELFVGDNVIGKPHSSIPTDVAITDDKYVSFAHACIRIHGLGNYLFSLELSDDGSKRPDRKASTNGTFLNGLDVRLERPYHLQDGEVFQVGVTLFVVKIRNSQFVDIAQLLSDALRKPYVKVVM